MSKQRRCLIVERHSWETGGGQQQIQLPLKTANDFFGGAGKTGQPIHVRVFMPPTANSPTFERNASVSKVYEDSKTRRINGFPEIGALERCFIFFEETDEPRTYDVWWQMAHLQVIAAKYASWDQGRKSQYGRGRLIAIVDAPVPRRIQRIDD